MAKKSTRIIGTKVVVNLNAKKGYRASPGVNARDYAKEPLNERKRNFKPERERVINLGQMDVATCEALNGTINENRQCMVTSDENPDEPDILILRKPRYREPGEGFDFEDATQRQPSPKTTEHKPSEEIITKRDVEPYSVDWAVKRIETCISKGYEEELCVGSILGEMRKKGKYKEFDKLLDEEYTHDFDDKLITIIQLWKNKYDTRFNEKMEYLKRQGVEETPRRRQMAINVVYPEYDRMMRRPLPPREERRREPLSGGEIPEWLYEEKTDSLHTTEKEQHANVIRYYEMTPVERKKALAVFRERNAPYDRRRKLYTTMNQEEREKNARELARNYYYLNRYGMTEEEYKKRKRVHS
jgi:hypothetical protein